MGRNSIAGTGIQPRVDALLDDGVTYAEISARTGASLPAVGRYALSRKSELARQVDGEPSSTEVIARLIEAADHAQDVRRRTRISGSPVAQSRAIKSEADVLARLITELGVTDTTVVDFETEARALVGAVERFVHSKPMQAGALLDQLAQDKTLHDLERALRARSR